MNPWAVPLSVEFFRQEYYSRLPFPSLGDLPDPGIKPRSPGSPTLAGGFFTTEPPGKPYTWAWCEAKGGGGKRAQVFGGHYLSVCPWSALLYPSEGNAVSSGLVGEAGLPMFRKLSGGRRCVDLYSVFLCLPSASCSQ